MKKLFIIHTSDLYYGACTSLKHLISHLDEKVDLMVPRGLLGGRSINQLRKYYGKNIEKIYREYLPFSPCYLGKTPYTEELVKNNLIFLKNKNSIYRIIKQNKYDVIHLNSVVLYPLLSAKFNMIIHIREVFDGGVLWRSVVSKYLKKAKGIIFIDEATRKPFSHIRSHSIILNNPIDQIGVLDVNIENILQKYEIEAEKTVYTFAASFSHCKGLEFLTKVFSKLKNDNVVLLLVGEVNDKNNVNLKDILKDKRIIYTGLIKEMSEIYAVTDYILRGESKYVIGRTVYEGLYSGCSAIIPGDVNKDGSKNFETEEYKDKIFFYKPRDEDSLYSLLVACSERKKREVLGRTNTANYISEFRKFIENIN